MFAFVIGTGSIASADSAQAAPVLPPVLWESPIADYRLPAAPTLAPPPIGGCADAFTLDIGGTAPCLGVLVPTERLQFTLDGAAQRASLLGLLAQSVESRQADRSYAATMYGAALIERDNANAALTFAKRQQFKRNGEAFAAGLGVGGGIVLGIVLGIAIGVR